MPGTSEHGREESAREYCALRTIIDKAELKDVVVNWNFDEVIIRNNDAQVKGTKKAAWMEKGQTETNRTVRML